MELKEYVAPALKWWWLILAATLIAGGSSYLATRQQPPQYRSTATLVVGSTIADLNPTSGDLYLTQQLASFYVNMAYRPSLQQDVQETLGLSWLPEIYVRNVNNLIDIIVTDTNPQRAQAVAAEIARQLILRSPAAQQQEQERADFINRQLSNYETAILEAQAEIEAKQAELATLISAREIAAMQNEIAALQASLDQLEGNYSRLISGTQRGAINSINIVEPATLPTTPINTGNSMTIAAAAAIGLVLAATAAYLLEYLDDSIKTPQQLARLTGLPVLSGIAEVNKNEPLITIQAPRSPVSEAYRVLRTGIQYSSVDNPSRLILITSATPNEGKSATAANLAVVIAQAGSRVLLVDADLRRPSIHRFFDASNRRGLTSLLLESDLAHPAESVAALTRSLTHETQVEGLHLLTSGPIPPNPSELLGSAKMNALLNALADQYDFVLLDSPPVLSVTDAVVLSKQVDGVLLVVRSNKTRRHLVRQAANQLQEVKAHVLGSVLNAIPSGSEGYHSYYYYQDDTYYQEHQTEKTPVNPGPLGRLRQRLARYEA